MNTSKIEWTDRSWNPVRGCSLVSSGCESCYAMKQAHRFSGKGQPYEGLTELGPHGARWTGQIRLVPEVLDQPLKIKKPQKIFVNSMSDLFHEDVPDEFIGKVFCAMETAKQHSFQVLTKRARRMQALLKNPPMSFPATMVAGGVLQHVLLGVSVEDQKTADERIPILLQTPATVRWISAEPLLGAVELEEKGWLFPVYGAGSALDLSTRLQRPRLDWVIVGGESGQKARPMHPQWVRSIRDQCQAAGVPFFMKQWGEWIPIDHCGKHIKGVGSGETYGVLSQSGKFLPGHGFATPPSNVLMCRVGKKKAGSLLDGREWKEFPA